jgi:pyridoxamine 5'-phosphate oxidase
MSLEELAARRRDYANPGIKVTDLTADPFSQFAHWLAQLDEAVPKSDTSWFEANAMVLSTAAADGRPSSRTVLLKQVGPAGFTFFTNLGSRKGRELAANPRAGLLFPWYPLERQVIVSGVAEQLPAAESDAYFATRPRGAQLGAWASEQSAPIADRSLLEARLAEAGARFPGEVPRPPHWGGIRIAPDSVEFWQGRPDRLHDRLRYVRDGSRPDAWSVERLSP